VSISHLLLTTSKHPRLGLAHLVQNRYRIPRIDRDDIVVIPIEVVRDETRDGKKQNPRDTERLMQEQHVDYDAQHQHHPFEIPRNSQNANPPTPVNAQQMQTNQNPAAPVSQSANASTDLKQRMTRAEQERKAGMATRWMSHSS
jgi:hypothetical protein